MVLFAFLNSADIAALFALLLTLFADSTVCFPPLPIPEHCLLIALFVLSWFRVMALFVWFIALFV